MTTVIEYGISVRSLDSSLASRWANLSTSASWSVPAKTITTLSMATCAGGASLSSITPSPFVSVCSGSSALESLT